MPKWSKFLIGLLLLPFCFGAAQTLWMVVAHSGRAETVWIPIAAGAACWGVVFLLLPKPMWIYVLGHELTHAVWTWAFGGSVKKFKASANGGQVMITKNNFLIALSPYFFPLYAMLVVLVYVVGNLIWGWSAYRVWFHFLLGLAYAFHVTLTFHVLKTRQSDITQNGTLFSAVIIFLGNAIILLIALPLLTGYGRLLVVFSRVLGNTSALVHWVAHLF